MICTRICTLKQVALDCLRSVISCVYRGVTYDVMHREHVIEYRRQRWIPSITTLKVGRPLWDVLKTRNAFMHDSQMPLLHQSSKVKHILGPAETQLLKNEPVFFAVNTYHGNNGFAILGNTAECDICIIYIPYFHVVYLNNDFFR